MKADQERWMVKERLKGKLEMMSADKERMEANLKRTEAELVGMEAELEGMEAYLERIEAQQERQRKTLMTPVQVRSREEEFRLVVQQMSVSNSGGSRINC